MIAKNREAPSREKDKDDFDGTSVLGYTPQDNGSMQSISGEKYEKLHRKGLSSYYHEMYLINDHRMSLSCMMLVNWLDKRDSFTFKLLEALKNIDMKPPNG